MNLSEDLTAIETRLDLLECRQTTKTPKGYARVMVATSAALALVGLSAVLTIYGTLIATLG
jgi:hypothetical protein